MKISYTEAEVDPTGVQVWRGEPGSCRPGEGALCPGARSSAGRRCARADSSLGAAPEG